MAEKKKYQTATAFREALERRIKQIAAKEGKDLQRLRRQVAFDRLLARLFHRKPTPWALKGGYALELRISTARATKDIDLTLRLSDSGSSNKKEQDQIFLGLLRKEAEIDLNDYFGFLVGEPILDLDAAPYGGARFPIEARMDGRSFIKFHLDLAAGDFPMEPLEEISGRNWLDFAGIPPKTFMAISKEQQFAEKIHAYTRPRERINSRARDLIDMVLLIESGSLNKARVTDAISKTFSRRKSHTLSETLDPPPPNWAPRFATMAKECGLSQELDDAYELLAKYFEIISGGK